MSVLSGRFTTVTTLNTPDLKLVNTTSVQCSVLLILCYVLARNWVDDTQCAQYVAQFKGPLANKRTSNIWTDH